MNKYLNLGNLAGSVRTYLSCDYMLITQTLLAQVCNLRHTLGWYKL